jgi:hypothetical protein
MILQNKFSNILKNPDYLFHGGITNVKIEMFWRDEINGFFRAPEWMGGNTEDHDLQPLFHLGVGDGFACEGIENANKVRSDDIGISI